MNNLTDFFGNDFFAGTVGGWGQNDCDQRF